jgi:asparagine synthetase B (glutamine-hydrolysing)
MCGIFFSAAISPASNTHLQQATPKNDIIPTILLQRLACRGPDSAQTIHSAVTTSSHTVNLTFHSTVLSLRGAQVTRQPLSSTTSHFCWNGEAWAIGSRTLDAGESDTDVVFDLLKDAVTMKGESEEKNATNRVIDALMSIQGPFAFVYHDVEARRVYFGRDSIGRRSLLYKLTSEGDDGSKTFMLSSVGDGSEGWKEVPAHGIFILDLCSPSIPADDELEKLFTTDRTASADLGAASMTCMHYRDYGKYATFNHTPPTPDQRRLVVSSPAVAEMEEL